MHGPGRYLADATEEIPDVNDLPAPKVVVCDHNQ